MRPQRLAVAEHKVERAVAGNALAQLAQGQRQFGHAGHPGMGFSQLLHDPAKRPFAVGAAHRPKAAVQARVEVFQITVVGKYPVAAPQFAHKRVAVLQRHHALGGFADVGNDIAAFDRVVADQRGHGRLAGRLVVDKMAQAQAFKKCNAPAVAMVVGAAAALGKAAKAEHHVGGGVAVHS